MRVEFHYYDARLKRWFTKVASRAAQRISTIVSGFDYHFPEAWSAEFTVSKLARTRVHRTRDSRQTTITVTFAAADWPSLDSSIDDATSQLASAVLSTVPPEVAAQLLDLFIAGGVSRLSRIPVTSEDVPPDCSHRVEFCFNRPDLDITNLHRLYDLLDARLQEQGLGLVDGSSWSRQGYCLDLSLIQLEPGLQCALDFATEHGHHENVTIADAETGEEFHRPYEGEQSAAPNRMG